MLAGLDAAEAAGGDIRGKQGAAIYVVKPLVRADYDDTLIDIRVDDHPAPLVELRRLLNVLRSQEMLPGIHAKIKAGQLDEALAGAQKARDIAPGYDLAVLAVASVSLRMGKTADALDSLKQAVEMNPRLKAQLAKDENFASLRPDPTFTTITKTD
jgi:tetratricopeptide (TPR) repeat protein